MPSTPVKRGKSWRCMVDLGADAQGKRHQKSFTASTKRECYQLACSFEASRDPAVVESTITLGEAIDAHIAAHPGFSPTTVRSYQSLRKNRLPGLMDVPLSELSPALIQQEIDREALVCAPKTVRNAHGLLAAVLAEYRPGLSLSTRLPKKKKPCLVIPTLADIEKLIAEADASGQPLIALAVMFGAQLGLRRSEICALTFADLADGQCRITKARVFSPHDGWVIKEPKTDAGTRVLPLTDQILSRLSAITGAPEDLVFPLTPNMLDHYFGKLFAPAGVTKFRFHDLRHYNASVMLLKNVPEIYIINRLGHASGDMVRRVYGHILVSGQEEVNRLMCDLFK